MKIGVKLPDESNFLFPLLLQLAAAWGRFVFVVGKVSRMVAPPQHV